MNTIEQACAPNGMAAPRFSLCVYCGSRMGTHPAFADAARAVGAWIGQHNGQLVYGGGNNGLMGIVAEATLAHGGRVVGVIPQALVDKEVAKSDCTELHVVANMHQRKALMAERSDAFLALPGGIGTFEELFEVWAWRHLGYHDKPLGLLNVNACYDQLLGFLNQTVANGFVSTWQMDLLHVGTDVQHLLPELRRAAAGAHQRVQTEQM